MEVVVMVGLTAAVVFQYSKNLGLPSCVCLYIAACASISLIISLLREWLWNR